MHLDYDYIIKILRIVEEHQETSMCLTDLYKEICGSQTHAIDLDQVYNHMMRIKEAGFLKCKNDDNNNFGFSAGYRNEKFNEVEYELTWEGHEYLRKMEI